MTRLLLACGLLSWVWLSSALAQPLFDYVNKPDSSFAWEKVGEQTLPGGVTWTELRMTSQTWQDLPSRRQRSSR